MKAEYKAILLERNGTKMRRDGAAWAWQGAEAILKTKAGVEALPVVESLNLRAYVEQGHRPGQFVLIAWKGDKAIIPFAHFTFTSRDRMMSWLQAQAESFALHAATMATRPRRHAHVADEVREIVKAAYPGLFSVTRGKGTAGGWTEIHAKDQGAMYTPEQNAALKALGLMPGGNFCCMDYRDAQEFVKRHKREQFRVVGAGA